ncbi:hypothetical protein ACFL3S_06720 [Gemmatimonadota bacterium]
MDIDNILRRLRGAFGNALVWGVGWLTVGLVLFATLRVLGVVSWSWAEVVGLAMRAGIVGGVVGGAFAGVIRLLYHGRRLSKISWVRFGIGGGVFAGVVLPLLWQSMNLLSGNGPVPWELVLDDALLTAFLGGAAAGGSMKLAQLTGALPPGDSQAQLDHLEGVDLLVSEGEQDTR